MKLPAGTETGTFTDPKDEKLIGELAAFRGALDVRTTSGTGFILMEKGRMLAAIFRTATDSFTGQQALSHMTTTDSVDEGVVQMLRLRRYSDAEFARAFATCRESGLSIADEKSTPPSEPATGQPAVKGQGTAGSSPGYLDQGKLKKILIQPGVIAVSAFFEGFPVRSMGDADFEHVAASAEDFMRAGVRIARDMNAGPLDQMILETEKNKLIIAPCGDLFLCVFTTADAQLGLIRVVLKSIQSEICR